MSKIQSFYREHETDSSGRKLAHIWQFSDEALEATHDYIQWLFPLPDSSRFNQDIPALKPEDIQQFCMDSKIKQNMRRSFTMMLRFYGFEQKGGHIAHRRMFEERYAPKWLMPGNHNLTRISRMLRSMALLGLSREAGQFMTALERMRKQVSGKYVRVLDEATMNDWRSAARGHVYQAPRQPQHRRM